MPLILLGVPVATALLCVVTNNKKALEIINMLGGMAIFAVALLVGQRVFTAGALRVGQFLYVDALGAFIVCLIALVGLAASLFSITYMTNEIANGETSLRRLKWYYCWLYVFIFTMLAVVMVNNLGVMWVAIEATTLASALLVGYHDKQASLEAAWKYIIICTVGIVIALFGTVLLYFAAVPVLGGGSGALDWTNLMPVAGHLDPKLAKLAFVFILVGYGTKVGLVPMHTWLPDAHSQAPSPVSALLSGVLLNCALYGILRVHLVVSQTVGSGFTTGLLLVFGLLSVGVALPFIVVQHDVKRLLAYSSIEHMGIVAAAVGLGGRLGLYGAFLHMLNHAITKSSLFFAAGNVTQRFHTKKIDKIKGALKAMPVSGPALLLGLLAIAGAPPFNIFLSEFRIFSAGFAEGRYLATGLLLVLVTMVFAGIVFAAGKMTLGTPPGRLEHGEPGKLPALVIIGLAGLALGLGIFVPPVLNGILQQVVTVMGVK